MKELSDKIVALVEQARLQVAKVANSAMVFTPIARICNPCPQRE